MKLSSFNHFIFDKFKHRHEKYVMIIKLCIRRLYSVTGTETCETLVQNLQKIPEYEIYERTPEYEIYERIPEYERTP